MELTLEMIKEIAKDIIDEQTDDNFHSPHHNRGGRLALKMLVGTLEHRIKESEVK